MMHLIIDNSDKTLELDFVKYLIKHLKRSIISSIDDMKLRKWDIYLNAIPQYQNIYKKRLSAKNLIIAAASNLTFHNFGDKYIIDIDSNQLVPNLDAKLIDVIKLITFGNMSILGYDLIDKWFTFYQENIEQLKRCFINNPDS